MNDPIAVDRSSSSCCGPHAAPSGVVSLTRSVNDPDRVTSAGIGTWIDRNAGMVCTPTSVTVIPARKASLASTLTRRWTVYGSRFPMVTSSGDVLEVNV